MNTKAVVRALQHYRDHRFEEIRSLPDLEAVMAGFGDDQAGNTALAQQPTRGDRRALGSHLALGTPRIEFPLPTDYLHTRALNRGPRRLE